MSRQEFLDALLDELYQLMNNYQRPEHTKRALLDAVLILVNHVGSSSINKTLAQLNEWNPFELRLGLTPKLFRRMLYRNFGEMTSPYFNIRPITNENSSEQLLQLTLCGTRRALKLTAAWRNDYPQTMRALAGD